MADYNIFHHLPWSGSYAIYFFTIGISAALFFFSAMSWFREEFKPLRIKADYVSFALLVVSGALLVGDLSQPMRFLYAISPMYLNLASPLAWGALNLASFGIVSLLYIVTVKKGVNEALARKLGVIGSLLALGLPVYTGFDLTVHQNRPVWNTPLMPVLFVALSLVSGAAVAAFLAAGEARLVAVLRQIMLWAVGSVAVMLVSLLGTTAYGGVGQELTFMILTTGSLSLVFLWLGVIVGTAAPIALLLAPFGRQTNAVLLSALLILVGGMALRYSILVGGQIVQTYF
jgi:formate-dependent nitrite reductase membrane component NrfD